MFSIIAGDPFSPAGYLTYRTAKAEGLIPDEVFSGFYRTEKLMSGKLGRAAETKLGAIMKSAGEALAEAEAEAAEEPTTDPEKAGAAHEASNPQPTTEEKTA